MTIPLQFASFYDRQEVFVWSNCLLDLGKRQGRHKKRWDDNIREWTGLEFAKSQRAVTNREKWREMVVKSSVVHQRSPPRLTNR